MTLIRGYALDEGAGSTAAEVGGGAALTGIPGWDASGRHGAAMRVNGVAGPTFSPFAADTAFTIMLDVFIVGGGTGGVTMILSGSELGNLQVINASGIVEWYLGPYPTTQAVPQAQWVNLAITADGTTRRVFIDGAPASGGSSASAPRSGTSPIQVGGYFAGGYSPNIRVDNLRVFDTALSEAEVAALAGTSVGEPPPPPNQPPSVSAGQDQAGYVGAQVTLAAVGSDADGTIASYAWTQTAGEAVVLAGAGANRTFTPATAGVRTFQVVATDDDGAQSPPDSVTVTTLDVPEQGAAVAGTSGPNLAGARRAVEALMDDRCRVTAPVDPSSWVLDENLRLVPPPGAPALYEGPFKFGPDGGSQDRSVGGVQQAVVGQQLDFPVDRAVGDVVVPTPVFPAGTLVTVTACRRDPLAVGQTFEVREPVLKTMAVKRAFLADRLDRTEP